MTKDFFLKQLDGVIGDFNTITAKAQYDDLSGNTTDEDLTGAISKAKAVRRISGKDMH